MHLGQRRRLLDPSPDGPLDGDGTPDPLEPTTRRLVASSGRTNLKALGWVLAAVGALGLVWAFKVQSDRSALAACCGARGPESPWAAGIGGVAIVLMGLVLVSIAAELDTRRAPDVGPGWYDDPTGVHARRYHDGRHWTQEATDYPPVSS